MKNKMLLKQIIRFGIVGGICFITDYIVLYMLSMIMHYLIASAFAYIISTAVNYTLSMKYVFESKGGSKIKEIIIFVLLSLSGLGLTEIGMFVLTDFCNMYYMFSKIFVTGFVMVFNFITRKLFIEKR